MSRWVWFGMAGHFCAAARCQYHLHTHVGHYCVSSVGDMRMDPYDKKTTEMIGSGRLYETMAFDLRADEERWTEIDGGAYNDEDAADAGHLACCERMAARLDPDCGCEHCKAASPTRGGGEGA